MARKKVISAALAAMLLVSSVCDGTTVAHESMQTKAQTTTQTEEKTKVVAEADEVNATNEYGLCDNTKQGAILHAWCWSFNTIKENLKDIAEAGFTTVQTSPANTCLVGEGGGMELMGNGKWYYHYQPVDWKIGNYQLGTRDDFKAMCDEADKYGVKIIVDVLPNHTTSDRGSVSQDLINAAGGMDKLYHKNWDVGCTNWTDRNQITNYKYSTDGCPDVCTENPGFQAYYVTYLNDLIECGVDGFRYDTAKHIGLPDDPLDEVTVNNGWTNNFWPVALGEQSVNGVKLNGNTSSLFIYGEVLQDAGSRDGDYGKIINLTASGYGGKLRGAIRNKSFGVNNLSDWGNAAGADRLVTWVESHDTYCNNHESGWMSDWDIKMCWAVIAARGSGTPLFYSRPDGSNGSQGNYWGNNRIGAKGNDQFKDPVVAACNHFRNAMVGEGEYLSNYGGEDCLVIERGTKGAVIINTGSQKSNVKLNKVADGTYTEEVSGKTVQVSNGVLDYDVPAGSIAVVYDANVTKSPSVSVSKDSGTFTEPFDLTLTPSNATKATYSINGGDAKEFTSKTTVKIGEDAQVGDEITVKVTATGEGDPFEKTFTYKMADAPDIPDAKIYIRAKKSDFTSAPKIYAYTEGTPAKELNGDWENAKEMTAEGDYYVWYTNEADSARVIFKYDGGQDPASQEPGYAVSGYMEYTKGKGVEKFTPAPKKTPTPKPEDTPTPSPKDTPTPEPTPTEKPSAEPTDTPKPGTITIEASKENGAEFTADTMDVKLTLTGATEGTYSVDDGPEKAFKSGDTVKVGQGKIADTDVKLKVTATSGNASKSTVFTYKKVFDGVTSVKTSALKKMASLFKVVADAATVDTGAPESSYYQTNPNGQIGSKKTIKSASDFSEDMIIAQGVANDDPAAFKGTHEAPKFDQYAMYGAWDDTNIYIGIQYSNVIDVVDPAQEAPQQDRGKPYSEDADIPQMLVFDTGSGDYTDGTANDTVQKTAWDINVKYSGDAKVDKVFVYSPKKNIVNQAFFPVNDGIVDYNNIVKTGYHYVNAEKGEKYEDYAIPGLSIQWEDGFFGKSMYGIKANGYEGYTPNDLSSSSAAWTDFLGTAHDTKHDTFCIVTLPLSLLGVSASDIENNGLGVMSIATYGASGIGSLPADMTMLDCATEAFSQDDSTSAEKEDEDTVTVGLARLGKADGGIITKPTNTPTKEPEKTKEPEETKEPTKEPEESKTPEETTAPTAAPELYTVNFGADRSAPQLSTTELTLKAIGYGSEGYQYEFLVDGEVVQKSSSTDTYKWKGTAGTHTIKVVVTDSKGQTVSSEKTYVIEKGNETATSTPEPTKEPSASPSNTPNVPTNAPTKEPEQTATPEPDITKEPEQTATPEPVAALKVRLSAKYASPRKAGVKNTLSITAEGGKAPYVYEISVQNSAGKTTKLLSSKTKKSVTWTPSKAGKYKLIAKVTDARGKTASKQATYNITTPISIKKFKLSNSKIKIGKKLTITANATSNKTVKYQFELKKNGAKKATVLKKYSKKKTCTVKIKKKGTYYIYLKVKDADGNTKTVKKKVIVKK